MVNGGGVENSAGGDREVAVESIYGGFWRIRERTHAHAHTKIDDVIKKSGNQKIRKSMTSSKNQEIKKSEKSMTSSKNQEIGKSGERDRAGVR